MPKLAVTDWDSNADNNTDVGGVFIGEGMPPSSVNNAMRAIMAQIASFIGGGLALAADLFTGTSSTKIVAPSTIVAASAPVTLTDGNTITPTAGFNFVVTLGALASGTRTLANPTGFFPGQSGVISLKQDSTGGRTIASYGSAYDFGRNGLPTLSGANQVDKISYYADSPTHLTCSFIGGFTA